MNKKTWILLIVLVVAIGGFFYWWLSQPIEVEEPEEKSQPPTLFAKEDYKIEEREDGKYIVVEKVGLTAKVPEGWKIEIEGDDIPQPEYWVRLFSKDYEPSPRTVTLPGKGCRIDVSVWTSKESNQKRKEIIKDFKNNDKSSIGEIYREEGYEYNPVKISGYDGIEQMSSENHKLSEFVQLISIDIPINDEEIITLYIDFPPDDKEKCTKIWEEFLENITIE